ncbi:MAG: hypothetical protein GF375_03555, partial [Candidatus Omnitrophica bacterium]|nr:hypothetical protein [Candidatus Omnitrophota bacterium]
MWKTGLLNSKFYGFKAIIVCLLLFNILSLFAIYSSLHLGGEFRDEETFRKQIIWIVVSWVILIIFSLINYRLYYDLAFFLYFLNLILLLSVSFFGKSAMGAQRWLSFFGLTF